jgi:dipeptidyl aminopeptidase/acylaminoacyl peptidase
LAKAVWAWSTKPAWFSIRQLARQVCGLAWSRNGKFLAIVDRESPESPRSIFLLDVETREKRKLTTPPSDWAGDGLSAFSPGGRTLAFARTHGGYPSDIYVLALSENGEPRGAPKPITKDNRTIMGLDWTAEGGPAIQFFPFAGDKRPEVMRLAGSPEDYYFATDQVDVSPDGRWFVYAYRDRNEADIMLVENFR